MGENKHTIGDLYQMQSLPLSAKIRMTERRIIDWIDYYGENGVYVSFSGGKDSTVLMDILRNRLGYKNVPAVFVDVPTQYPELKEFALTWDNVEVLKPKISFMQVCKKYGFPIISKEITDDLHRARSYLRRNDCPKPWSVNVKDIPKQKITNRIAQILGIYERDWGKKKQDNSFNGDSSAPMYNKKKWLFMLDADFEVSSSCCDVMKKKPIKEYAKRTHRNGITAQMAEESRHRLINWLKSGCNGFDLRMPTSNPMSFWTEQDVLLYIAENKLPICSVYGDIVEDWESVPDVEGQMTISDIKGFEDCGIFDADRPLLKTTGCKRTGCMLCGFGCHLEKPGEGRFELLKQTHPKMYALLDVVKNNGVTFREAIDWINEHGNLNIRY